MVPLQEIKSGDWVKVMLDGQLVEGQVEQKSVERAAVAAEGEVSWYLPGQIHALPLTEDWLYRFDFEKSEDPELNGEGQAYVHGPFVLRYPEKDNPLYIRLSCHGEHDREFRNGLFVHQFQNHYHGMTKVYIG